MLEENLKKYTAHLIENKPFYFLFLEK